MKRATDALIHSAVLTFFCSLGIPNITLADVITFGMTDIPILINAGPQTEGAFKYEALDVSWEVNNLNNTHALWTQFNSNVNPNGPPDFAFVGQQAVITSPGNYFTFHSVDIESATGSTDSATHDVLITGLLGNQIVGTLALTSAAPMQTTVLSPFSGLVDRLLLELTSNDTYGLGLDNFVLTPTAASIPEPTSLALLGMTAAGFCGVRIRRRRKDDSADTARAA